MSFRGIDDIEIEEIEDGKFEARISDGWGINVRAVDKTREEAYSAAIHTLVKHVVERDDLEVMAFTYKLTVHKIYDD